MYETADYVRETDVDLFSLTDQVRRPGSLPFPEQVPMCWLFSGGTDIETLPRNVIPLREIMSMFVLVLEIGESNGDVRFGTSPHLPLSKVKNSVSC